MKNALKLAGREITGIGVVEVSLDGLAAKEFCLAVQYKDGRRYAMATLPKMVKENKDLLFALPAFVGDTWNKNLAHLKARQFSEKYNIPLLNNEHQYLLKMDAEKKAEKAAKKVAVPEKTAKPEIKLSARIYDIVTKRAGNSKLAQAQAVAECLTMLCPAAGRAAMAELRRVYLPKEARYTPGATASERAAEKAARAATRAAAAVKKSATIANAMKKIEKKSVKGLKKHGKRK